MCQNLLIFRLQVKKIKFQQLLMYNNALKVLFKTRQIFYSVAGLFPKTTRNAINKST